MKMNKLMECSDYELVKSCLNGNHDSFEELVTRYKRMVYSVVYKYINDREEAQDVSQEVFIKIYKSLATYNPQYKFSTWAVKVTTNMCLDILRKKKLNSVPIEEIEAVSREEDTPEKEYISRERALELRNAISKLPEKYRAPIILFHQKGASYKEMCDALKEPMSVIKNRLYRARVMLRENLAATEA